MTGVPKRSAGIVPVRMEGGAPRLLLLRCFSYWDFPKGEVKAGEDPRQTAVREFAEETGLETPRFLWGDVCIETEPYGRGKVARYYLAAAPDGDVALPVSPELGRPEHHEYRWVTPDEAETLLNARLRRVLRWATATIAA